MAHERELAYRTDTAQPAGDRASWLGRLVDHFRHNRARLDAAHALYVALVEQARRPLLYAELGVPDSRGGRLELINIHAILVMRRLRSHGQPGEALAQSLFDVMFHDVDQHLREWGVGDLSVGKHVRKLAQSFYGRAAALDPLLDACDRQGLEDVLRRNVYTEAVDPAATTVARLADYVLAQDRHLAEQHGAGLLAGTVRFAAVETGIRP
jgi:cytochrome b pre-mRNA-processing protein 3